MIDANFAPQILNEINNTIAERFYENVKMNDFIEAHQELPTNLFDQRTEWRGLLNNTYTIHQSDSLLFVHFSIYKYFPGAAHGYSNHCSVNFNLTTGKELLICDIFKTDPESKQIIKTIINQNLPDSICTGIQQDQNIIPVISNYTIIPDSVIFAIDDNILCPIAFGVPQLTLSQEQLKSVILFKNPINYHEISTVIDEGEIATH